MIDLGTFLCLQAVVLTVTAALSAVATHLASRRGRVADINPKTGERTDV